MTCQFRRRGKNVVVFGGEGGRDTGIASDVSESGDSHEGQPGRPVHVPRLWASEGEDWEHAVLLGGLFSVSFWRMWKTLMYL